MSSIAPGHKFVLLTIGIVSFFLFLSEVLPRSPVASLLKHGTRLICHQQTQGAAVEASDVLRFLKVKNIYSYFCVRCWGIYMTMALIYPTFVLSKINISFELIIVFTLLSGVLNLADHFFRVFDAYGRFFSGALWGVSLALMLYQGIKMQNTGGFR